MKQLPLQFRNSPHHVRGVPHAIHKSKIPECTGRPTHWHRAFCCHGLLKQWVHGPNTAMHSLQGLAWLEGSQVPNRNGSQTKAAHHETLVKSFPAAFVQGDNPSAHASGLKRCLIQLSTSCQPGPRAPEGADWEQAQALQVRLHCCACMPLSVSYKTERGPAAAPAWFAIRLLQYLSKSKLLLQIPLKSTSIAPKAQR